MIGIPVPHNYFAPWPFVKSILSLSSRYKYFSVEGHSVPDNRNIIFHFAKLNNEDLLFIDSDSVFTPVEVHKMQEHLKNYDIITGIQVLTGPPYKPMIFKRIENEYKFIEPPQEMAEIDACGAGFLAISKRVFPILPENPFSNLWEGMVQHGEDISFCHRVKEAGLKIWCDPSIKIGHIRTVVKYYED